MTPDVTSPKIRYRKGYSYQLAEDYSVQLQTIRPDEYVATPHWVKLTKTGLLTLHAGYAWDGATKARDTKSFMRPSAVHDGLYQLIRRGFLAPSDQEEADKEMRRLCREDGMGWFRAWYAYRAVRWQGHAGLKRGPRPILEAP